jgi:hypothetical protein
MTAKVMGLCLVAALVAAAGCGDGKKAPAGDGKSPPASSGGDKSPPPAGTTPYEAAKSTASVAGTVKYAGAKPAAPPAAAPTDPFCSGVAGKTPIVSERAVVADDGGLPHCFVWAQKGPHKQMSGFPASPKVVLDQTGCTYVPHVFGLRVGEPFTVKNSDDTSHNVHSRPKSNTSINKPQAFNASDEFTYDQKETAIPFNCDIHTWMSAYAFVLDHPFFAVTDASGKFEIKGLPAGTYTFKVWHESFSPDKAEMSQDVEVTVKDGEAVTKDVEFK